MSSRSTVVGRSSGTSSSTSPSSSTANTVGPSGSVSGVDVSGSSVVSVAVSSDVVSVGLDGRFGTDVSPVVGVAVGTVGSSPGSVPDGDRLRRRRRLGAVVAGDQQGQQGDGHRRGQGGDPVHVEARSYGRVDRGPGRAQEPGPQARLPCVT